MQKNAGNNSSSSSKPPESATWKYARQAIVLLIGVTLLLVGVALLVLPGPGIVIIGVGIGILATEFVWARRIFDRAKKEGKNVHRALKRQGWYREILHRIRNRRPDTGAGVSPSPRPPAGGVPTPPREDQQPR